jgi:hypothetical protein
VSYAVVNNMFLLVFSYRVCTSHVVRLISTAYHTEQAVLFTIYFITVSSLDSVLFKLGIIRNNLSCTLLRTELLEKRNMLHEFILLTLIHGFVEKSESSIGVNDILRDVRGPEIYSCLIFC